MIKDIKPGWKTAVLLGLVSLFSRSLLLAYLSYGYFSHSFAAKFSDDLRYYKNLHARGIEWARDLDIEFGYVILKSLFGEYRCK